MNYINFPLLGNGLIVGITLLIHVFLTFLAIGSLTLAIIAEIYGKKNGDPDLITFAKRTIKIMADFMKVNGVLGVIIVVLLIGLWGEFSLVLWNATFWVFVAEGTLFLLLMISSIIYRRTFDSNYKKVHITAGLLASFAAIGTGFLINGIWAFMLNPGEWLKSGSRVDAFFTPLLFESFLHLLLPCIINTAFVIFLWSFYKLKKSSDEKNYYEKINKLSAKIGASVLFLQPISGFLFYLKVKSSSSLLINPTPYKQLVDGLATPFFVTMITCASTAVLLALIFWIVGYKKGRKFLVPAAIILMFTFFMGAYTREKARKPYLIHSYMEMDMRIIKSKNSGSGVVDNGREQKELSGEQIFKNFRCQSCHALNGSGGSFASELDDLSESYNIVDLKEFLKEPGDDMPAFTGSENELEAVSKFLLKK